MERPEAAVLQFCSWSCLEEARQLDILGTAEMRWADSCMVLHGVARLCQIMWGMHVLQRRLCRVLLLHAMSLHTEGLPTQTPHVLAHVLVGKLLEFRASRKEGSLASWSNPGIWIAGTA